MACLVESPKASTSGWWLSTTSHWLFCFAAKGGSCRTLEKSLGIAESDINALKLTVKESISRDRSFKSIKKSINLVSDGLKEKLREVESLNNELEMLVRMLKDNPNYNKQEKKKILFNLNDKKREGRIALAKLLRSKHSSVV